METWDSGTLSNVKKIPLLTVRQRDETGLLGTFGGTDLSATCRFARGRVTGRPGTSG